MAHTAASLPRPTPQQAAWQDAEIGMFFTFDIPVFTDSAVARWALANLWDGPTGNLAGLLAQGAAGPAEAPALFAVYDMAARVNWRDSWDDLGTGV